MGTIICRCRRIRSSLLHAISWPDMLESYDVHVGKYAIFSACHNARKVSTFNGLCTRIWVFTSKRAVLEAGEVDEYGAKGLLSFPHGAYICIDYAVEDF